MPESELEKAYRKRQRRMAQFSSLSLILWLAAGSFLASRFHSSGLVVLLSSVGLFLHLTCVAYGSRIFFNHAWRQFDAPYPDPSLNAEGQELARSMGVRLKGVTTLRASFPGPVMKWEGRTLVASQNVRDLPAGERRFMLAFWLALGPEWPWFFGNEKKRNARANQSAIEATGDLESARAFWNRMEGLGWQEAAQYRASLPA